MPEAPFPGTRKAGGVGTRADCHKDRLPCSARTL